MLRPPQPLPEMLQGVGKGLRADQDDEQRDDEDTYRHGYYFFSIPGGRVSTNDGRAAMPDSHVPSRGCRLRQSCG